MDWKEWLESPDNKKKENSKATNPKSKHSISIASVALHQGHPAWSTAWDAPGGSPRPGDFPLGAFADRRAQTRNRQTVVSTKLFFFIERERMLCNT